MPSINVKEILNVSKTALVQHGSDDWVAAHVAEAIAASESVGNRICGLYYLESYCEQLISGRVSGRAYPEVHLVRPSSVYVDAKDGFAQPAFSKGLPEVLKVAQENGIASLSIGRTHTCTSLGFFTKKNSTSWIFGFRFYKRFPDRCPSRWKISNYRNKPNRLFSARW